MVTPGFHPCVMGREQHVRPELLPVFLQMSGNCLWVSVLSVARQ